MARRKAIVVAALSVAVGAALVIAPVVSNAQPLPGPGEETNATTPVEPVENLNNTMPGEPTDPVDRQNGAVNLTGDEEGRTGTEPVESPTNTSPGEPIDPADQGSGG